MYPSGVWRGFWQQDGLGRQPMEDFLLHFRGDTVEGSGRDVVGRFTFYGECDAATGRVRMVKQYVGKHAVAYDGGPDGEGSIRGTWHIEYLGLSGTGPFVMQPVLRRPTGNEPIVEITK